VFEDVQRVIVVVAHPDDMETLIGGTIAMLTDRGVQVVQVLITNGDIGASGELPPDLTRVSLAAQRQAEARAAAEALGVHDLVFLDRPDSEVVADLELRADIARAYRQFQPDTLFTFDPWYAGQAHPDHTAAGRAAIDAYMPSKMPLYRPEQLTGGIQVAQIKQVYLFGGSANQDIVIDVTLAWQRKTRATLLHRSQFSDEEKSLEWMRNAGKALGAKIGVEYGEGFSRMQVW
jgi:LmbE family N-acetylglucosaminyl deacetylase